MSRVRVVVMFDESFGGERPPMLLQVVSDLLAECISLKDDGSTCKIR